MAATHRKRCIPADLLWQVRNKANKIKRRRCLEHQEAAEDLKGEVIEGTGVVADEDDGCAPMARLGRASRLTCSNPRVLVVHFWDIERLARIREERARLLHVLS